jgi:hypothetical protein
VNTSHDGFNSQQKMISADSINAALQGINVEHPVVGMDRPLNRNHQHQHLHLVDNDDDDDADDNFDWEAEESKSEEVGDKKGGSEDGKGGSRDGLPNRSNRAHSAEMARDAINGTACMTSTCINPDKTHHTHPDSNGNSKGPTSTGGSTGAILANAIRSTASVGVMLLMVFVLATLLQRF